MFSIVDENCVIEIDIANNGMVPSSTSTNVILIMSAHKFSMQETIK